MALSSVTSAFSTLTDGVARKVRRLSVWLDNLSPFAGRGMFRFRSFNMLFEEICQKQCCWSVPDSELCASVILSVAELLLPAYRNFVERFGPLVSTSRTPIKYIKHTPKKLEELLGSLFEGKQDNSPFALHSSIARGMRKLKHLLRKRRPWQQEEELY